MAVCASYIVAKEIYETMPNRISSFYNKVDIEEITYEKIGIELSGIEQSELLDKEMMQEMNNELMALLIDQDTSLQGVNTSFRQEKDFIEMETFNDTEEVQYKFSIKNQKDITYNTYCKLRIIGHDTAILDKLRSKAKSKIKEWIPDLHESIYFMGHIKGKISDQEGKNIVSKVFKAFSAEYRDYYEDDLNASTYVYYGYTSCFDEFIKGKNNMKINMQVGFKYNDEMNQTEVMIAFPFYNLPF